MFYKKHSFQYNVGVQATLQIERSVFMANQTNSLSHTKWMCKYHIVFTLSIDEKSFTINTEKVCVK